MTKTIRQIGLCLLLASGCGGGKLLLPAPPRGVSYDALPASSPLPPGENIRATEIARAEHVSLHLVQIRHREAPHVHTRYDLTVLLLRGEGILWLAGRALAMQQGDTALIPRDTPHWFENTGPSTAAALVGFAPPFDGPDNAPVGTEPDSS